MESQPKTESEISDIAKRIENLKNEFALKGIVIPDTEYPKSPENVKPEHTIALLSSTIDIRRRTIENFKKICREKEEKILILENKLKNQD